MTTPTVSAPSLNRREFLTRAGALAAAASLAPTGLLAAAAPKATAVTTPAKASYEIGVLEKWFFDGGNGGPLKYTPDEMAQTLAEIGLDLELTLRKQGHITPEKAPDELPVMAAALARKNRRILWVALDTVRPDEPHWEKAIRVAKQLGIPQYRHRGFSYTSGRPLKAQIADFHSMAKDFAAVNKAVGIQAVYQIHAGARSAGSAAWDLDLILGDIDPKHFGVAFDTRHVMVEQGQSWPNAVQLLAPRTVALCVKSFKWDGDQTVEVPLGEGRVKKAIVDQVIAAHGGPLPICIHVEHFKDAAGKLAPVPFAQRARIVEAIRADARVLRGWLGLPQS
ncbi:sugar phosphate isomerase/epimerase family protein [Horticoccus sp. 23ND18S-11]|uniref:sugar phosphate isomerase/epimerase family protein n=1 Tax=Horticoccus sp. 23ND18S-11 TaxID=3391832 RepID=UPI0039C9B72F